MTDTTTSPFKRRGFIAAAIVVGIIILAAIIVLISSLTHSGQSSVAAPSPTESSATPTPSGSASVCGLPGYETVSSLTTAPAVKWELVGTLAAPDDPNGAGPGTTTSDGFRSCYAHTAEGALFAAVNYGAMHTDSRLAPEVTEKALVPGPGRDAAMANQSATPAPEDNLRAQIVGFKVDAYNGDQATIDLVLQVSSSGALVSIPTVLQWSDGDWKGVTDDAGNSPLQPAQIENLGGYIPWSGA